MVTIEELKLGNKTLEALKFLLLQINELDVILNELNFEELREANNQAKTQIEVLNNIKTLVLNTEKSIEQVKVSIDSRSEEINTTKREIEDAKTNIIKAKDDTTLIYENISSKSERIEQKYNEIGEIKKGVDRKFDDIKTIEEQSRDMANEITNNKNIILKKIDENINTLNNTISKINILKNETLQEIATTKAGIDTKANEALNTATSSLNEIKTILNDFKGKQTELNALKASLETLKNSLENLNKSGLINDTQAGIAQTYSSNKINNLLQGVLRESDAAESNANGKLVKRNAQGNIYATNIYLNATTKAEVSDIKNALATDKWRFIVRDTGEGLLRSMSIKDFISSQEIDAYSKAQSDSKYLTEAKGDTRYVKTADADLAYMRVNNAYTQTEIDKWFAKKTELTALTNSLGDIYITKTDADNAYVKSTSPIFNNLLKADVDTQGKYKDHAYVLKAPDGSTIKSLAFSASPFTFPAPDPLNQQASLGTYAFLLFKNEANNRQALYVQPAKALWDYVTKQIKDYYKSFNKPADLSQIDLSEYVNFEVTLKSKAPFYTIMGIEEAIGQSGVIIVHNAANITGWNSMFKWREGVPTALKGTEVFAYFVASATEIYMGRA
ncbi:hypothetical protein [Campylobacter concisus]|uniref:hypothetical protein n=1 Tax=Campylobacter concisus TaxID=199 RepID=UPI000CD92481|nr:hypothetical protein [Campylobacter concisus]